MSMPHTPEGDPGKFIAAVEKHAALEFSKDEAVNTETVRVTAEDFEGMMEARGLIAPSTVWIDNFNNVYQIFVNALNSILITQDQIAGLMIGQEAKDELNGDIAAIGVLKENLKQLAEEAKQYVMKETPEDVPEELKVRFRTEFHGLRDIVPKYLADKAALPH